MEMAKVACVHCGGQPRDHEILHEYSTDWHDRENDEQGSDKYQICKCRDCERICFRHESWISSDFDPVNGPSISVYTYPAGPSANEPLPKKERHPWLVQRETDIEFMGLALEEARKSQSEPQKKPRPPMVGAVVAHGRDLIAQAHRGEINLGEHAEYTLLEGKCAKHALAGATVYTTLEPCTTRGEPKVPCVDRLIQRKVARVVIGMLDPDERIRGRGILALRKANIQVDLFPPDLMNRLEELNRDFIRDRETVALARSAPTHRPTEDSSETIFRSQLASLLYDVLVWADTPAQMRKVKPWFDRWQNEYGSAAAGLLDMAADEVAVSLGIAQRLREIADALSEVSTFRSAIGSSSWAQIEARAARARELVVAFKSDTLDIFPPDRDFANYVREEVKRACRKLSDLSDRARLMVSQNRTADLQSDVGNIGTNLAKLSFYDLRTFGNQFGSSLRGLGMKMRLVEATHIDAGAALARVLTDVSECATTLASLTEQLSHEDVDKGATSTDPTRTAGRA